MKLIRTAFITAVISIVAAGSAFAQAVGSLGGQVVDSLGAVVVGATVTVVGAEGKQKQVITNAKGEYNVTGLPAGKYTVKAIAPKFALYENADVTITGGEKNDLIVVLTVEGITENVDVQTNNQVSNEADNNKDATIIKGSDLEALPDDPDELQAALQALAGAAAGPNGGQIYIDGFTGGQMPSKESIREIRINSNPFSAEYDRIGFGRIEILTRPGSDKFRGSFNTNFNDESLNSRNPFAVNRASTQRRNFGGNVSGPIRKGKSSFFLDVSHNSNDNNAVINAQVVDPSFAIVPFRRDIKQPTTRLNIAPRFDLAINDKNTLVFRYSYGDSTNKNQGIGDTSLPGRAYMTTSREHEFRITETMIINPKTVNETRFEFSDNRRDQTGDNTIPTVNVTSSFTGGGASIGNSFNTNKTFEINNFTSTSFGKNSEHSFKFGGRLRHVSIVDRSESNYAGTYLFPGFLAASPCDINGDLIVSSIEQYRCKVSGVSGALYNPTQFSMTTGNPELPVSQFDAGLFATDDWKLSPALLLSFGLRYENQNNISSNFNFAPRFGFAWSPGAGGAKAPKTVFRGGGGVFYERFSENYTLQAERNNGVNQLNLLVSANDPDPARRAAALILLAQPTFTLTGVTNSLTASQILAVLPPQTSTIRQVSDSLHSPYTMQTALSVERALSTRFTLSSTFMLSRTVHALRTRNTNAPVCSTPTNCIGAVRPNPTLGNINVYESSGIIDQKRIMMNLRANISRNYSLNVSYGLGFSKGDTDGAGSSPSYMYDLTGEYGRSSSDVRHQVNIFGNMNLWRGFSVSPNVTIISGRPFNITRGTDSNGDGVLTERPTFGELQTRCNELNLRTSFCNIGSNSLTDYLPRNFGEGPASVSVNLRISKNWGFGKTAAQRASGNAGGGGGDNRGGGGAQMMMMGGGGGGGMRGPGGGGFGGFGGGDVRKPYNLNFSVDIQNLFNIVNLNNPVGSLSSSRFGQSTSSSCGFGGFGGFGGGGGGGCPNRRINLSMRFNW